MKSLLSRLLFETAQPPTSKGRTIRFDVDEPDIRVATGPLDERIALLLQSRAFPMTVREIAAGIASNASQVNKGLKILLAKGRVEIIEMPGSVKEYALRKTQ